MTRRLEELFGFDDLEKDSIETPQQTVEETKTAIATIDLAIDKIDEALPAVRGLDASDNEMDDLASKATETFDDLMNLGMQVDSRYSSEIFAVASTMLGHAITAKTAKLNKKLKMVDLQMKKLKMDQDKARAEAGAGGSDAPETAHGQILSRNDLLERLMTSRDQNNDKA
jgi:hypothetical protein